MKAIFIKLHPSVLFIVAVTVVIFTADTLHTIFLRPQSVHQWRQTDCASQALNYYQNHTNFWTPQEHSQTGENGYGASEFPIIYYFVSKLYTVFGFHEYIFRTVDLLIFVCGLWFLFLTCIQ